MRELLFKAKRIDNGEWVEGGYFCEPYADKKFIICWNSFGLGFNEFIEVVPDTICQFTGLLDKNGNKIWENDIVSFPRCEYTKFGFCFETYIGKMYWDENLAFFDILCDRKPVFYSMLNNKDLQVIGNIFDNADLLEVE